MRHLEAALWHTNSFTGTVAHIEALADFDFEVTPKIILDSIHSKFVVDITFFIFLDLLVIMTCK